MLKVYCEHGALSKKLLALRREGRIELVHFPYDPEGTTKFISPTATVSEAQWRDFNIGGWNDLAEVGSWADIKGSEHLPQIRRIIGASHRRDCLHVDSAFKSGCRAFVTADRDILNQRGPLEALLGIRFFHPVQDAEALCEFIGVADSP